MLVDTHRIPILPRQMEKSCKTCRDRHRRLVRVNVAVVVVRRWEGIRYFGRWKPTFREAKVRLANVRRCDGWENECSAKADREKRNSPHGRQSIPTTTALSDVERTYLSKALVMLPIIGFARSDVASDI